MTESWTPPRAANRLVRIAAAFSDAHGINRFPVNIPELAFGAAEIFDWHDPITQVKAASIKNFEGALFPNEGRSEWLLLFNDALQSPGRIRFTQAHELGHYILHRQLKSQFECSEQDMLNWTDNERDMEAQADKFASYLLMPLDDFRAQIDANADLDSLSHCADRYGVSLTAAILKWLQYTEEQAVLLLSRDGFILWASSSRPALKAGAYFRTRDRVIPIPEESLAADDAILQERQGREISASLWFPYAPTNCPLREMKLVSDQFSYTLTLLRLPHAANVWPPKEN